MKLILPGAKPRHGSLYDAKGGVIKRFERCEVRNARFTRLDGDGNMIGETVTVPATEVVIWSE